MASHGLAFGTACRYSSPRINDPPNLNTGTAVERETEIRDREWCIIEPREPVDYIADILCRKEAEIREKMGELGLKEARRRNRYAGLKRALRVH